MCGSNAPATAMATTTVMHIHDASVRVLGNRVLWDTITNCMTGYPYVVAAFIRASSRAVGDANDNGDASDSSTTKGAQDDSHSSTCDSIRRRATTDRSLASQTARLTSRLSRRGALVHRAIAASDAWMLKTLHRLSTHTQYRRDARLSFRTAMRCAVAYNSVYMMQRVAELLQVTSVGSSLANTITHQPCDFQFDRHTEWGHDVLRIAIVRDDPDLHVLDWLATHLPRAHRRVSHQNMLFHARRGDVATVQWLRAHGGRISRAVVDAAVRTNQLHMLQFLYAHSRKRCSRDAVNNAAARGHLAVIEFVVVHDRKKRTSDFVVTTAAAHGQLDVVRFMTERADASAAARDPFAINSAAAGGHLDVVQYLYTHLDANDSTVVGLQEAAANGHVDVVRFLHEHRPHDCCPEAIGDAARRGHLSIVQYLHAHSHDTCEHVCTPAAFDKAATQGHLDIVRFLHEHRHEGCTANALDGAAKRGHADVAAFLCEHRSEGNVVRALRIAALHGHTEIVHMLHSRLERGQSTLAAVSAALRRQHHGIVRFLCEHQDHETERILHQAVENDEMQVVRTAARYASVDELVEAAAFAAAQNQVRAVEFLSLAIERR